MDKKTGSHSSMSRQVSLSSLISSAELWVAEKLIDPALFFIPIFLGVILWADGSQLQDPWVLKVQEYISVWLIILVLFSLIFVALLQHRRKSRFLKIQQDLSNCESKCISFRNENNRLMEDISQHTSQLYGDLYSLVEGYLLTLARDPLEFGMRATIDECHERITLYVHDSEGSFIRVGRLSFHPEYNKKSQSRVSYPDNQGCISKAWKNGSVFSKDYPDPDSDLIGYVERSEKDGIPREVVERFRMKSRLYYGIRIWDSKKAHPLAVLILEATHSDRYTKEGLDRIFNAKELEYVGRLVEIIRRWTPDYKEAKKRGL